VRVYKTVHDLLGVHGNSIWEKVLTVGSFELQSTMPKVSKGRAAKRKAGVPEGSEAGGIATGDCESPQEAAEGDDGAL
jgi:hypothetical protein